MISAPVFSATSLDKLDVFFFYQHVYFLEIKTEMKTFAMVFGGAELPSGAVRAQTHEPTANN